MTPPASTEIVPAAAQTPAALTPPTLIELQAVHADVLLARRQAVEKVVREVMVEGIHFGHIPGVPGKILKKPGTEILAATFQLALEYLITTDHDGDTRRYTVTCRIIHQPTGAFLGSGIGYASTGETAFRWRKATKHEYDAADADRRREKFYTDNGQEKTALQVREEPEDKTNTVLKMAGKRAAADAVAGVLGVRGTVLASEGDEEGAGRRGGRGRQQGATANRQKADGPTTRELDELEKLAARKGRNLEQIAILVKEKTAYGGPLEDMPREIYAWIMEGLATWRDKVDPETGEVIKDPAAAGNTEDAGLEAVEAAEAPPASSDDDETVDEEEIPF
jgi:hypothetical protein